MTGKWKVFRERVPKHWDPQWVVWADDGEYTFYTGREALAFVHKHLTVRALARRISERQEQLREELG